VIEKQLRQARKWELNEGTTVTVVKLIHPFASKSETQNTKKL
jgi:hypothetical protein